MNSFKTLAFLKVSASTSTLVGARRDKGNNLETPDVSRLQPSLLQKISFWNHSFAQI